MIAPSFVSSRPAGLLALAITLAAATRMSMPPTVVIGVASAGVLRWWAGFTFYGDAISILLFSGALIYRKYAIDMVSPENN